jgi:hypothetical protein
MWRSIRDISVGRASELARIGLTAHRRLGLGRVTSYSPSTSCILRIAYCGFRLPSSHLFCLGLLPLIARLVPPFTEHSPRPSPFRRAAHPMCAIQTTNPPQAGGSQRSQLISQLPSPSSRLPSPSSQLPAPGPINPCPVSSSVCAPDRHLHVRPPTARNPRPALRTLHSALCSPAVHPLLPHF